MSHHPEDWNEMVTHFPHPDHNNDDADNYSNSITGNDTGYATSTTTTTTTTTTTKRYENNDNNNDDIIFYKPYDIYPCRDTPLCTNNNNDDEDDDDNYICYKLDCTIRSEHTHSEPFTIEEFHNFVRINPSIIDNIDMFLYDERIDHTIISLLIQEYNIHPNKIIEKCFNISKYIDILPLLIEYNADINIPDTSYHKRCIIHKLYNSSANNHNGEDEDGTDDKDDEDEYDCNINENSNKNIDNGINIKTLHLLIENKCNLNCLDINGFTPLHLCVVNRCDLSYISLLIENNASISLDKTERYDTIAHRAAMNYPKALEFFMSYKYNSDKKIRNSLSNDNDIIRQDDDDDENNKLNLIHNIRDQFYSLLQKQNYRGQYPINIAIKYNITSLKILLSYLDTINFNIIDDNRQTLLHYAVQQSSEILRLILDAYDQKYKPKDIYQYQNEYGHGYHTINKHEYKTITKDGYNNNDESNKKNEYNNKDGYKYTEDIYVSYLKKYKLYLDTFINDINNCDIDGNTTLHLASKVQPYNIPIILDKYNDIQKTYSWLVELHQNPKILMHIWRKNTTINNTRNDMYNIDNLKDDMSDIIFNNYDKLSSTCDDKCNTTIDINKYNTIIDINKCNDFNEYPIAYALQRVDTMSLRSPIKKEDTSQSSSSSSPSSSSLLPGALSPSVQLVPSPLVSSASTTPHCSNLTISKLPKDTCHEPYPSYYYHYTPYIGSLIFYNADINIKIPTFKPYSSLLDLCKCNVYDSILLIACLCDIYTVNDIKPLYNDDMYYTYLQFGIYRKQFLWTDDHFSNNNNNNDNNAMYNNINPRIQSLLDDIQ